MIKHTHLIFLAFLLFAMACGDKKTTSEELATKKLSVVATTGMIADALKNIGGDSITVEALMGPGVDPHLYKATQGDLKKLTGADAIFYNGLHLEGKMGEIFEKLGRIKPVFAIAEDIDKNRIRSSTTYKDAYDPHVWFDVSLWKNAVQNATKKIQEIDPDRASYYEANTKRYLSQLDSLHSAVAAAIQTIPEDQRVLITAHDAFEYFGAAYGIQVRGLQGISTLSEFGLKDVSDLVSFITENEIKAVFVETSVSTKSIKAVVEGCEKRGHDVEIGGYLFSDAMGDEGSPEGNYIGMVNANVRTITKALK